MLYPVYIVSVNITRGISSYHESSDQYQSNIKDVKLEYYGEE